MQYQPCDIQSFLNFSLYRAKQVSTHLLQQLCQKNEQPVLKILLMDLDEIYERLQEHTEDLNAYEKHGVFLMSHLRHRCPDPLLEGHNQARISDLAGRQHLHLRFHFLGESIVCLAG